MIKKILCLLLVCSSCFTAFGQSDSQVTAADTAKTLSGLFDRQEIAFQIGFSYSDVVSSKFNPSLGLSYFPTKYFGLRGSTVINVSDATAFNNADFVGIVRLPLWVVSPYFGGGGRYLADGSQEFSALVLGGVEARINRFWSIFAEANHCFTDGNTHLSSLDDWSFRGGVNLRIH